MRGIDPRDFALLPFGGAGPLHAAAVADELGMRTVVVPPLPGNFSALGLLIADVRRDFVRTRVSATAKTSVEDVRSALRDLVRDGEAELTSAGFAADRQRFAASLDMRYAGQSFELSVPVALDVGGIAAHRACIRRGLCGTLRSGHRRRDRDRELSPGGVGAIGQAAASVD